VTEGRRPNVPPPPRRPGQEPTAPKHVIAEYRHRVQEITCVCGWVGSSFQPDGRTSEWSRHVASSRQAAS
jgi:hypothetical protein